MTQNEQEGLERDYALYIYLLDYYAKNREDFKSMTDNEYRVHIDAILDEINRLKKLLEENNKNTEK